MAEKRPDRDADLEQKIDRLAGWVRLLVILFRAFIVVGLLVLIILVLLILLTSVIKVWVLVIPLMLILLGIVLARLEYYLHGRLYDLKFDELEEGNTLE